MRKEPVHRSMLKQRRKFLVERLERRMPLAADFGAFDFATDHTWDSNFAVDLTSEATFAESWILSHRSSDVIQLEMMAHHEGQPWDAAWTDEVLADEAFFESMLDESIEPWSVMGEAAAFDAVFVEDRGMFDIHESPAEMALGIELFDAYESMSLREHQPVALNDFDGGQISGDFEGVLFELPLSDDALLVDTFATEAIAMEAQLDGSPNDVFFVFDVAKPLTEIEIVEFLNPGLMEAHLALPSVTEDLIEQTIVSEPILDVVVLEPEGEIVESSLTPTLLESVRPALSTSADLTSNESPVLPESLETTFQTTPVGGESFAAVEAAASSDVLGSDWFSKHAETISSQLGMNEAGPVARNEVSFGFETTSNPEAASTTYNINPHPSWDPADSTDMNEGLRTLGLEVLRQHTKPCEHSGEPTRMANKQVGEKRLGDLKLSLQGDLQGLALNSRAEAFRLAVGSPMEPLHDFEVFDIFQELMVAAPSQSVDAAFSPSVAKETGETRLTRASSLLVGIVSLGAVAYAVAKRRDNLMMTRDWVIAGHQTCSSGDDPLDETRPIVLRLA